MPAARKKQECDKQLEAYKDKLKEEAEGLVLNTFPVKVIEVHHLVTSDQFCLSLVNEMHQDTQIPVPDTLLHFPAVKDQNHAVCDDGDIPPAKRSKLDPLSNVSIEGTKVMGFVTGTVTSNEKLVQLIEIVKPVVREAVENVNKLKMWISFLIPRIEDGNNFGVSIQEDTLSEVRTVEAEAASFLDQISRYFLTRGRIVTKIAKYPHVDDYRRALQDLDEKEFLNLRLVLMEIRNHYSSLHDIIVKNLEKIKTPRNSLRHGVPGM